MASRIKITGKVKWVKPEPYTAHYNLVWFGNPTGKPEIIAEIGLGMETWHIWIKYAKDGDYYLGLGSRREAQEHVEEYYGISRKKYARPKEWHPFGL